MQKYRLNCNIKAPELALLAACRYLSDHPDCGPMYIKSHPSLLMRYDDSQLISAQIIIGYIIYRVCRIFLYYNNHTNHTNLYYHINYTNELIFSVFSLFR